MLARENRLKKNKDFEEVLKKGKGKRTRFLFLKALKKETPPSRFGFVVSKKISKKAVVRNKIKRRMREAVKPFLTEVRSPVDAVLIAFPGIEKEEYESIQKEVKKLLKELNLLEK